MTERKKWRVSGYDPKHVFCGDRVVAQFDDPADAARIVALNNAGGEPAAWQAGDGLHCDATEHGARCTAVLRGLDPDSDVHPLYRAAPVVPEPPAKVEWRVSEERLRNLVNRVGQIVGEPAVLDRLIVSLATDALRARAALARRPARPATPVIDGAREMAKQWQLGEIPIPLETLRAIIAEDDAVIEWAEGRKG